MVEIKQKNFSFYSLSDIFWTNLCSHKLSSVKVTEWLPHCFVMFDVTTKLVFKFCTKTVCNTLSSFWPQLGWLCPISLSFLQHWIRYSFYHIALSFLMWQLNLCINFAPKKSVIPSVLFGHSWVGFFQFPFLFYSIEYDLLSTKTGQL